MIDGEGRRVAFVCFPKTHLLDLAGPAQVFYEAIEYGAKYELSYLTTAHSTEPTSSGLVVGELVSYQDVELLPNDLIIIPGFDVEFLLDEEYLKNITPFLDWLNTNYQNGVSICSVCTGAFVLAETGLLKDKSCTTHWKYLDVFAEKYPDIEVVSNRLFVEEDGIYSSAGVSSGIDLSLYIIEQDYGSKFAQDVAREVVIYMRRNEGDPQLSVYLKYRNHIDDRIHEIQDYIIAHINQKVNLDTLAELIHTSERNLTRTFKNITGITIGAYIDKIRVEHAIKLIGENNKMDYVALQCGFNTTNQLYKLLRKHDIDL